MARRGFRQGEVRDRREKVLEFYRNQGTGTPNSRGHPLLRLREEGLFIDITVSEGKRYYIGRVTFEGNALFTENQLRGMLEFGEGDPTARRNSTKPWREDRRRLFRPGIHLRADQSHRNPAGRGHARRTISPSWKATRTPSARSSSPETRGPRKR